MAISFQEPEATSRPRKNTKKKFTPTKTSFKQDHLPNLPFPKDEISREIPRGDLNGFNPLFHLSHTPIEGSEHVYLNGLLQESGNESDYIIEKSIIIFHNPPEKDFKLRCTYYYNL
jgi:hypothetical protein